MDAKDLRTETALGERNNDGSKYSQSGGTALHCDRNKSYQDIGSNSLAKVDVQNIRPCAVIGPDRIIPPPASSETYLTKAQSEPWSCIDNAYHNRLPPEYPHKLVNFQNPTRNISPRQTFQENMQRIMVPPSYSSITLSDESKYTTISDRNSALHKNIKINMPPESKFCDVPYNVYPKNTSDQKSGRTPDVCLNTVKPTITRTAPPGWPPGSVNIHPTRAYGASELYPYQDYSNCAGPRPALPRCNRNIPEDSPYVYTEPYYHQEGNIRFKPYPPIVKERLGHQRYDYIGNYSNTFHPPPAFHTHKYELQKPVPPHPYPPYGPIKYLDRPPETIMDGYQRNQQGVYNIPYHNQAIHPNYGSVLGNTSQNKLHPYSSDGHIKSLPSNKQHEYENGCPKIYGPSDNYLVNEMGRMQSMKGQVVIPNYPAFNIQNIPLNTYYKKDSHHLKGYEYIPPHIRSMDPSLNIHNSIIRHGPVYPSTTLAMSPTDSSGSTDTSHLIGTSQEDCGYVSQSSSASIRSIDSGINRIPNEYLRKYYDSRFGPIVRTNSMISKNELNANNNSKEKKNLNVRQFLQMWNEGDEETEENKSKEIVVQAGLKNDKFNRGFEVINQPNQEQLYVLGLVNVPSEELGKYEHIQKVSKLPENIKGYNHIELLNQFEEAIESSNMGNYKIPTPKDYQIPFKGVPPFRQNASSMPPRPISPLDVEAKISQSIIHKEVGCNFDIKPCSPKMLNVEVATPVQNILAERSIEKVANPVMLKSPRINAVEENINCNINRKDNNSLNINNESVRIPSCKMVNPQFSNHNSMDAIKNSYSLHDLESSSGLCLASLPRLDNDIELNFPEVNQQFINANKKDSASLANSVNDLPALEELDQSSNKMENKLNNIHVLTPEQDVIKSPCFMDSEKDGREFLKLSKYRKSKSHSSDLKEIVNATRTDSVIIKNPENSRNYDENIASPSCFNHNKDVEETAINLTSQGISADDAGNTPSNKPNENKETDMSIDIAIDFSLNKTNSNDNFEYKSIESLTHNIMESNNSILDNNLTKDPLFSYCEQNNISNPIDNIGNLKENESNADDIIQEEINKANKYLSPQSNVSLKIVNSSNEKDCTSPETCLRETNNVGSTTLLPLEFMTPAECVKTSYDNDDSIDKNHKLDSQTVYELNDVLNITNTQKQVIEIVNKSTGDKKSVESVLDMHQSNKGNFNQTDQPTSIEYAQNIKDSDLKVTDHLNDTGRTTEIENHQSINCLDTKLTYDPYQNELAKDIEDSQNTNCSVLKSPDDLNQSGKNVVQNPQNLKCSDLKSQADPNHTEQTTIIKDPEDVNCSYMKLTDNTNHIKQTKIENPQNIMYDLNYSQQPTQIQHPLNIACPDSKSTDKEISENDDKDESNMPNNISKTPSDDIIIHSQDIIIHSLSEGKPESESNNNIEISVQIDDSYIEPTFNTATRVSPNRCKSDYQNSDFNLPSPKDTTLQDEAISSQNDIDTQIVDHCQTDITMTPNDSNFDVPSSDLNDIYRHNIDTQFRETDSDMHHPTLNNTKCSTNDYQLSQITQQDIHDKVTIISNTTNHVIAEFYDDHPAYHRNLLLPENDTETEISCIEKKCINKRFDETTDEKVNASCPKTSLVNDEKRNFIPQGYLSYSSKEMYSPQIQNLLLFDEGIITTEKVSNNHNNYCASTDTMHNIETSTSSNNCVNNDHYEQSKTDSMDEFVLSTIDDNVIETKKSGHNFVEEHYSNSDGKDVNIELETKTINENLSNINTFVKDNELQSLESVAQNVIVTKNVLLTSTSASIAKDTINNFKLPEVLGEVSVCLSPALQKQSPRLSNNKELTNITDILKIRETGIHSVCSDETHELEMKFKSKNEERSTGDDPSTFNNNLLKPNDNVPNQIDTTFLSGVDEFISMEKQFASIENTSEPEIDFEISKQDKKFNCSQKFSRQSIKENNEENDISELIDNNSNLQFSDAFVEKNGIEDSKCATELSNPVHMDNQYNHSDEIIKQGEEQPDFDCNVNNLSECPEEIIEPLVRQHICTNEVSTRLGNESICNDAAPDDTDDKNIFCVETTDPDQVITKIASIDKNLKYWNKQSNRVTNSSYEIIRPSGRQSDYSDTEQTCTHLEIGELLSAEIPTQYNFKNKKRQRLKRSLSDSALNIFSDNEHPLQDCEENEPFLWPLKRKKTDNVDNQLLAQNLCSIIQSNRRNSVSTFYNEDNVSFCILIDNSCIIAEEENDEQEKICYTEISAECLAEIPDDSESHDDIAETMTESVTTSQQETDGDNSDSYLMQNEDNKLTESWVEDVGCVETIIDDDIAENVEISGPSSPKDDVLSDNDELGVFSSSEHTDKVKFIYGDKMCNDDAQFVQILYNTPQMDVNKTLIRKENVVTAEYYDNDSLEKILSDPGDNKLPSYLPRYTPPENSSRVKDAEVTKDKKIESISSWQKPDMVDVAIHQIDFKENSLNQVFNDQNDIVHSCESSVDNVFTYNENTEDKNYITSSSPEVSSTTSEDKNSAILLKITNYKGSRVSQVNDISRDRSRPRCKFTEDKGYIQSHVNFPTHRPILTKGAQKYIPPLKESIRDLKVKLSLPPNSLLKLKQLKNSKEQPKVYKQANSMPKYSKKPKPKFEDVLKNIDEIQFKMHKNKAKKTKKSVPKVVIKKNENGSHYASTSSRTDYNPDLTGRKWQPWVFIEKNHFIDKMAVKRKIKAVYSHRKKAYVLAEKFQKYKSVNDAKFIITPPVSDSPSTGLKYTIRLKHNY